MMGKTGTRSKSGPLQAPITLLQQRNITKYQYIKSKMT